MMRVPRQLALASMMVIAALSLGAGSGSYYVPAAVIVITIAFLALRFRIAGPPRVIITLIIGALFAFAWRQAAIDRTSAYMPEEIVQVLGFYALAIGAYYMLCTEGDNRIEQAMASTIVGLALSGTSTRNDWFFPLMILFMVAMLVHIFEHLRIIHSTSDHRPPPAGPAFPFIIALALLIPLGWCIQVYAVRKIPAAASWGLRQLSRRGHNAAPGFSSRHRMESVSKIWDRGASDEVLLRVFADQAPGHLRAMTFSEYRAGAWHAIQETQEVAPQGDDRGRSIFPITPEPAEVLQGTAYPESDVSEFFFLPLGTQRLSAFSEKIVVSEAYTARPSRGRTIGGYGYYTPTGSLPPPTESDLMVPPHLMADFKRISDRFVEPDDSPMVKVRKIEEFHTDGYAYELGIDLSHSGKDPVLEFLEDIKVAHCEYFAAAGTLLLRAQDIPARYVTGLVCIEQGLTDGLWLARRKDAHAWVEAYVPGRGWITVDPTPPDNRPTPQATTRSQQWKDYLKAQWQRVLRIVSQGGLKAIIGNIWYSLGVIVSFVPIWIWLAIIVGGVMWIWRDSLLGRWRSRSQRPTTARARALRKQLRRAEKIAARHGHRRDPSMPVGHFLREIQQRPLPEHKHQQVVAILEAYQQHRFAASTDSPTTNPPRK